MLAPSNPRASGRLEPSPALFRPHPLTPKRSAGQPQPFFPSSLLPALQEDPQASNLNGWLVDGDESAMLIAQSVIYRSVHLILGDPSAESLELLLDQLEPNTLLLLPPLSSLSTEAVDLLKRQPRQHRSQRSLIKHLNDALTSPTAISALLSQAGEHAVRWKSMSVKKPSSRLNMVMPSARQKTCQDKLQDDLSPQPFSPHTDPTLDTVLYFLPPPTDSSLLKQQLSMAFLITTASISLLTPKISRRQPVTRPNSSTHRESFLAPSSYTRNRSSFHSSDAISSLEGSNSITASSRSKSSSFISFSDAGSANSTTPLSAPANNHVRVGMLVHVLPTLARSSLSDGTFHAVFAHSLDKFQQRFLEKNLAVTMITLPEEILQNSPVPARDGLVRSASWSSRLSILEEEEIVEDVLPSSPMTIPTITLTPTPNVLSLLLSSAIKPPLLPLPSWSRRGSSSSLASRLSVQSTAQYGSGTGYSYPALADINSFLPSADAILFIPSSTGSPAWSSSSSASSDHKPRQEAEPTTPTTTPTRVAKSIINLSRKQEKSGWIGRLFDKRERGS